ncbi:AAA family ATPase [Cohnella sp.]|uniref:AAA family ATPase n=1 Tax=Cohnella sp. TaxID=1883426 RepID=UPI0037044B2F
MNNIYLPDLKNIEIKNYSLYQKDIYHTFIHGVNLIIGGNGVGKTTFINLIRYGLIGLYKKDLDVRTYRGEKRLGRLQYSMDYFRNRMLDEYEKNKEAEVTLTFKINTATFKVTRGLYDIVLKRVEVLEDNGCFTVLKGELLRQDRYERLTEDEKVNYLQNIYEQEVSTRANINDFNDLIFFVNQVLFFDEDRKTIVWEPIVQERLSSKYFNDPSLDEQFQEAKRQAKYHDSISRHKSEDMRAIGKIIKRIEGGPDDTEIAALNEINLLKEKLQKAATKLNELQIERKKLENKISVFTNERVDLNRQVKEIENIIKDEEAKIYHEVWGTLNPHYNVFKKNITHLHSCPMCNQSLDENITSPHHSNDNECFLCHQDIRVEQEEPGHLKQHKEKLNYLLLLVQSSEKEIFNLEGVLKNFDGEYNKYKNEVFKLQSKLRDLDFKLYSNEDKSKESLAYTAMMAELEQLEKEKQDNSDLSEIYNQKANNIIKQIENNLSNITKELSALFADFAGDFLGLDCKLTFDNLIKQDVKMYIPIINRKPRLDPLELSESQRFFSDQSFRMSLLSYFYTGASFFVCETPDSSLDLSYEANAAEIFLKYLYKPNALIVTSNLNNSEFIDSIIDKSKDISFLNLLDFGRMSQIQRNSTILLETSRRIEEKINAKEKFRKNI